MSAASVAIILAAMKSVLETVAPARVVTDSFAPFDARPDADLQAGVITVLFAGVQAYDYEHSASFDGVHASQTENALVEVHVTGQGRVHEDDSGAQVTAAELSMLADIEALANAGIQDDALTELRIMSARTSSQLEAPYYWVHTVFHIRHDGD